MTILQIIACIVCGAAIIVFSIVGDRILGTLSSVGLDVPVMKLTGGVDGALGILVGILVMVAGSVASWLIAFIPYGLGQLIQNTDKIAKGIDGIRNTMARTNQNPVYQNPVYIPNPVYYYPQPAASPACAEPEKKVTADTDATVSGFTLQNEKDVPVSEAVSEDIDFPNGKSDKTDVLFEDTSAAGTAAADKTEQYGSTATVTDGEDNK